MWRRTLAWPHLKTVQCSNQKKGNKGKAFLSLNPPERPTQDTTTIQNENRVGDKARSPLTSANVSRTHKYPRTNHPQGNTYPHRFCSGKSTRGLSNGGLGCTQLSTIAYKCHHFATNIPCTKAQKATNVHSCRRLCTSCREWPEAPIEFSPFVKGFLKHPRKR